jgi:hypothetical protein
MEGRFGQPAGSSVRPTVVISREKAVLAARQQAVGIAAFLTDLTESPSVVAWNSAFQTKSQEGVALLALIDDASGDVLFLLLRQRVQFQRTERTLLLPNDREAQGNAGSAEFSWLPADASKPAATIRYIAIDADPQKYQFRANKVGSGWQLFRDSIDSAGQVAFTEKYDARLNRLIAAQVPGPVDVSGDAATWTPEKVKAFLQRVVPLKWSNDQLIPWGVTKTSTPPNGDEYIFHGIYTGYATEQVTVTGDLGKTYVADLVYVTLLVPDVKNSRLRQARLYLYQNMDTTGIRGYTYVDPMQGRVPAPERRGQGGSLPGAAFMARDLHEIAVGSAFVAISPSAFIRYTAEQFDQHYERRPEAVVAFIMNGKDNDSYRKAQAALRRGRDVKLYAAEWLYIARLRTP